MRKLFGAFALVSGTFAGTVQVSIGGTEIQQTRSTMGITSIPLPKYESSELWFTFELPDARLRSEKELLSIYEQSAPFIDQIKDLTASISDSASEREIGKHHPHLTASHYYREAIEFNGFTCTVENKEIGGLTFAEIPVDLGSRGDEICGILYQIYLIPRKETVSSPARVKVPLKKIGYRIYNAKDIDFIDNSGFAGVEIRLPEEAAQYGFTGEQLADLGINEAISNLANKNWEALAGGENTLVGVTNGDFLDPE
jgi:hypothetical protein